MKKIILITLSMASICLYLSCNKDDGPNPETMEVEITGFSPTSGEEGTEVTINGKNFSATKTENTVTFNGTSATVKEATSTSIKVDVPNGATTGKIKVAVGNGSATSTADFTVTQQATPAISGIDPMIACEGGTVTISGTNFGTTVQGVSVHVGESMVTIDDLTETSITVQIPAGTTSGSVKVQVGSLSAVSGDELIIATPISIDGYSPMEGEWGSEITIDGSFMEENNMVALYDKDGNPVQAEIVTESSTQIVAIVPDGARTGSITVSNPCFAVDSETEFTVFPGRWTKIADFSGTARSNTTAFVVNGKAYVGLGTSGQGPLKDIWSYDPQTDTWTEESAILPGDGTISCSNFVINEVAYLTPGLRPGNALFFPDCWEFNSGSWTAFSHFEGIDRFVGVGFSIDGKGYLGTGYLAGFTQTQDFWQYDPESDVWFAKADVGGIESQPRSNAIGVSLNGKGYVGTGYFPGDKPQKDFWEYDPNADAWTQKTDIGGPDAPGRANAVSFALNGKIYVGTGTNSSYQSMDDFWEYDPDMDTWSRIASIPVPRANAVAFVLNGKAYVGTGYDGLDELADFWELDLGN